MSTADRLIARGRTEGLVEGRASILLHVRYRVLSANIDELDRWAAEVIHAVSLAGVFAGRP